VRISSDSTFKKAALLARKVDFGGEAFLLLLIKLVKDFRFLVCGFQVPFHDIGNIFKDRRMHHHH
jgi:hypothetical protein